jgi:hypothetical protein
MAELSSYKVIREISTNDEAAVKEELNTYLAAGWTLLDIHQRTNRDLQTGQESMVTVYIVGHTDPQANLDKR